MVEGPLSSARPDAALAKASDATSFYMVAVLLAGTILHPELKAFYGQRRGNGDMKNTASAIDTGHSYPILP